MSYKNFKDIDDVCNKLDLNYESKNFLKSKKITIDSYFVKNLNKNFDTLRTFISEISICERIIFPIISYVADANKLPLWSHARFDIDKKRGLNGEPDYLLGIESVTGMKPKGPVVCLGEAKKNNFEQGWGQVAAEMYAAQLANINIIKNDTGDNFDDKLELEIKNIPIYGLVTDGKDWEFGMLHNNKIIINKERIQTPQNLQENFNTLNWLFCEARKNADQLLKINKTIK